MVVNVVSGYLGAILGLWWGGYGPSVTIKCVEMRQHIPTVVEYIGSPRFVPLVDDDGHIVTPNICWEIYRIYTSRNVHIVYHGMYC